MKLKDAVVFVTGANRGIGLAFAREALARGARKVYAGARDPSSVTLAGVVPVALDVTKAGDIEAAARNCPDVTLLVNNAGIADFGSFMTDTAVDSARRHLEVNFFGPLLMTRAFAPILAANGGGAIINVLSVASWLNRPALGVYGASKTAAWGLTNALRNDLRAQNTQVLGMHVGFVDTDLTKGIDAPKTSPDVVVQRTYDGLEDGATEVLADERTQQVHRGLSDVPAIYLFAPSA
jgi:NAD(P)-dependent dehydrogenase (short-subunit alcohol dehydrogenase family)